MVEARPRVDNHTSCGRTARFAVLLNDIVGIVRGKANVEQDEDALELERDGGVDGVASCPSFVRVGRRDRLVFERRLHDLVERRLHDLVEAVLRRRLDDWLRRTCGRR